MSGRRVVRTCEAMGSRKVRATGVVSAAHDMAAATTEVSAAATAARVPTAATATGMPTAAAAGVLGIR